MKKVLMMAMLLIIMGGCINDEIPELSENILDDDSIEYFNISSIEFEFYSTVRRNVIVNFTSIYDQLSDAQKSKIKNIKVTGDGDFFTFPPQREYFKSIEKRIGRTLCYEIRFVTITDEEIGIDSFCFEVLD